MSLNEPVAGAISGAQAPEAPPVLGEGQAEPAAYIAGADPASAWNSSPLGFNRRALSCGWLTTADLRLHVAMPGDGRRNRSRGLRSIGCGRRPSGRRES